MNELGMYAVYDLKGERYDTPFFCVNDLFAERHFRIMISKNGTMVSTFKNDFRLEKLGTIDIVNGEFKNGKKLMLDGIQIQKEVDNNEINNEA